MMTQSMPLSLPVPLPIKNNLTILYATSIIIAVLMAAASFISLMDPSRFYPNDALLQSFVPTDWVNLIVGVPFLLVTMILARRGKLIGLLCWPGALFYSLYVYIPYLIAVPFSVLFPVYLVLIPLNTYTMIGIVASVDADAVRRRLDGYVPARVAGGILVGLTVLIILRQSVLMFTALANPTAVSPADLALWIADLAVSCPAMLIGGCYCGGENRWDMWQERRCSWLTACCRLDCSHTCSSRRSIPASSWMSPAWRCCS